MNVIKMLSKAPSGYDYENEEWFNDEETAKKFANGKFRAYKRVAIFHGTNHWFVYWG